MLNVYFDVNPSDPHSTMGKGQLPSKYMIVGMAPSPNRPRERRNEPFGARSWKLLNLILDRAPPGGVYCTNLIKTEMVIGEKLPKYEMRRGYYQLLREIRIVNPERILVLGSQVAGMLCPGFQEMKDDHGVLFYNQDLSNLVGHKVTCVPTYHFSAIGRDPLKKPYLLRDLERFFGLPDPAPPKYQLATFSIPKFKYGEAVYLDLETEGFDPFNGRIISVGLGVDYSDTALMYQWPDQALLRRLLKSLVENRNVVIGQNLQFDLYWLTIKSEADWFVPVEDTMLRAHNMGEPSIGLKHLTTMYTDRPGPHAFGSFQDLGYAAEDIHSTREVRHALDKKRAPKPIDYLMHQAIPELVSMRDNGVFVDRVTLRKLTQEYRVYVAEARAKLNRDWGITDDFNWNSGDQVVKAFQEEGIELTQLTKTGKFQVNEAVLMELAKEYPKVQTILDYRAVEKTLTGFFEGYLQLTSDEHPYLHPLQDLKGAITGRTSMKGPNLQQVTRTGPSKTVFKSRWYRDRNGYVMAYHSFVKLYGAAATERAVEDGYLVCVGKIGLIDLAQAELRSACLISVDEEFAEAIRSGDPHRFAASIAFKMRPEDVPAPLRKKVKGVVFGKLYGGSNSGLAKRIGVGEAEVKEVDQKVFGRFKKLASWLKMIKEQGVNDLFIEDVFGRRRDLQDLMWNEGPNSVGRKACNTPIQALASHMAMTILTNTSRFLRERGLKTRTLFGIHDSTLLDIHPEDDLMAVCQCVQDGFMCLHDTPLRDMELWPFLPIEGELIIGKSWAAVESTAVDYFDKENNIFYKVSTQPKVVKTEELVLV